MMALREMTMDEKIIRQSIAVYQATIEDLCRRRDELAAMLPNAQKPIMRKVSPITGKEYKQGGGKKRKANVG